MARGRHLDERLDEGASRLTVAAVLSPGPVYTEWHVDRLRTMVNAHLDEPHQFVCITDSSFPGWWAKLNLFEPGRFEGRVLYLDLDVTVVGDLYRLVVRGTPFSFGIIQDYQHTKTVNSSVMVWDAGSYDHIFTNFTPDVMDRLHGDQNWIMEQLQGRSYVTFPRGWCPSYRQSVQRFKAVPPDAKVVVFHGVPKPWDLDDNFNRLA